MRLRLLRRRLTVSAPRMAVRSALPWPVRWAVLALMLGFCGAIALWAFEMGKNLAGLSGQNHEELVQLRQEVVRVREERDKLKAITDTSESRLTAERATQEALLAQINRLEQENRALQDDLGFFEKLIPAQDATDLSIRGLQVEHLSNRQMRWQVLVIQPVKNAPEFQGRLEIKLLGTLGDKPWEMVMPESPAMQLRQYRRLDGVLTLPDKAVVRSVTARVLQGDKVRATRTLAVQPASVP